MSKSMFWIDRRVEDYENGYPYSEAACSKEEYVLDLEARLAEAEALLLGTRPAVASYIRKHTRAWNAALKRGDDFHVRKHCEDMNTHLALESRIDAFLTPAEKPELGAK